MKISQLQSSIKSLFLPSPPKGRSLQLRIDAAKVYSLIQQFSPYASNLPPSQHEEDEQSNYIGGELGISSLPSLSYQAGIIKYHFIRSTRGILQATYNSCFHSTATATANDIIRNQFDFIPTISTSTIPHAGRGLFIDGHAKAGSVVAIYPGITYLPSQIRVSRRDLNTEEEEINETDLSDYMIARYDGVIIDGSAEISIDIEDIEPPSTISDNTNTVQHKLQSLQHPFANAHLVNHPPSQEKSNVLQFIMDIDIVSLGPKLAPLMPVRPCETEVNRLENYENIAAAQRVNGIQHFMMSPQVTSDRLLRTVVLVALRDMKDEEIFMDYRFNPKVNPPSWYRPCGHGKDATRRWFPRGVFY